MKNENKEFWFQVGERIKQAKEAKGFSVYQLADKLDTSPSMIWKWTSGHSGISVIKLCEIASVLNVSVSFLLGEKETRNYADKKELLNITSLLSNKDASKVLPIVKAVLDAIN